MPELPDLEYIVHRLGEAALGRTIAAAAVFEPIVLRVTVPGEFAGLLGGRSIESIGRRGHFVTLALSGGLSLVVNPMLAGRFKLAEPGARREAALCVALTLEDGPQLRYLDDKKMGKVYLVKTGDDAAVPGLSALGIEVLAPAFTLEVFQKLARKRRDQVRAFLMDKSALAAIGNAYADEILWGARIHPKTRVGQLGEAELASLHASIGRVMRAAVEEVARRQAPTEEKIRDFLSVRGRKGQPCPRCGTTIRAVRVLAADACFCPTCQPARRSQFIDWSKLPKK